MNVIRADEMDFEAYAQETEPLRKVKPAAHFMRELIDDLGTDKQEPRSYLPWDKTHRLIQFRPGEVSLWAGVNGQGKSLITGQVALSLVAQGERVCVASFEMKPRRTLERMCRQWTGQSAPNSIDMQDAEILRTFRDIYEQFSTWTSKHLWLYDQQGTVQTKQLVGVLRYCAKELGIKHFFIDSLMKCIAGEDDYNGQKSFVDEITAIARDYGMHIHLIHHIRKLSSEEQTPDKHDVKGSGSITDQVDNLLLVWRNKKKEREAQAGKMVSITEPDALLICDKQRNGEWEGRVSLWFQKDSQQFVADAGAPPLDYYGGFPHRSAA